MEKKEIAKKLNGIQAASIADVLEGACGGIKKDGVVAAMKPEIICRTPSLRMAGTAYTVLLYPFDNLSQAEAMQQAQEGDVIVTQSVHPDHVCFGELYARAAVAKGIAGFVTNGATRDLSQSLDLNFPQFTGKISVKATFNTSHRGALQIPILVGGVLVRPGDWIVGDDDGVVVIPAERILEVIDEARKWDEEGEAERCVPEIGRVVKESLQQKGK